MALVFESKVIENQPAFIDKVNSISKDLSIDPNWLMTVMNSESGLNHRIVNSSSGATGLIQFMPDTASGLGTSVDALKNMSNVSQLDYVKKYLQNKTYKSYYDLYLQVFYPAAKGKPDTYVIGSEKGDAYARKVAVQNRAIDLNGDGYITLAEFKQWTDSRIPNQVLAVLKSAQKFAQENPLTVIFGVLTFGLGVTALFYYIANKGSIKSSGTPIG